MVHCLSFRRALYARSQSYRTHRGCRFKLLVNLGLTEMRRLSWLVALDPLLLGNRAIACCICRPPGGQDAFEH
jgi:hypothetical protein